MEKEEIVDLLKDNLSYKHRDWKGNVILVNEKDKE